MDGERIRVKTLFSGWREVDVEAARRWAQHVFGGMAAIGGAGGKQAYIDSRLEGATCAELLGMPYAAPPAPKPPEVNVHGAKVGDIFYIPWVHDPYPEFIFFEVWMVQAVWARVSLIEQRYVGDGETLPVKGAYKRPSSQWTHNVQTALDSDGHCILPWLEGKTGRLYKGKTVSPENGLRVY
jgi:hypothetical protein